MEDIDENLNSFLGDKQQSAGFSAPDGYFDSFSERMAERIVQEKQKIESDKVIHIGDAKVESTDVPTLSLWDRVKPFAMLAAVICGVALFIGGPVRNMIRVENPMVADADIADVEALYESTYLTESAMYSDLLSEEVTEENIDGEVLDEAIEYYMVADVSSYELSQYE